MSWEDHSLSKGDLVRLNRRIKKRLQIVDDESGTFLADSLGRKVDGANLTGIRILRYVGVDESRIKMNSFFNLGKFIPFVCRPPVILNRSDVEVLFGYDFKLVTDDDSIVEMLKIVEDGVGDSRANAYVLGSRRPVSDGHIGEVPVGFYIIPQEVHKSLSYSLDEVVRTHRD